MRLVYKQSILTPVVITVISYKLFKDTHWGSRVGNVVAARGVRCTVSAARRVR